MNRSMLAAALLASSPLLAAGQADMNEQSSMEGVYAAIGGGGVLMYIPGDNAVGYDLEARVGYSFNPTLQVFLAGALDGGSFTVDTIRTEQVVAFVQYHPYVRPSVMGYARGGIGVGFSGDVVPGSTASGLAGAGGLGVEMRVAPNLFVAPEIFYRYTHLSAQGTDTHTHTVGLQLNLVYY